MVDFRLFIDGQKREYEGQVLTIDTGRLEAVMEGTRPHTTVLITAHHRYEVWGTYDAVINRIKKWGR